MPASRSTLIALVCGSRLFAQETPPADDNVFAQHGFTGCVTYFSDVDSNVAGGLAKGSTYKGMALFTLEVDLEKALGLKAWRGHFDVMDIHGTNISERYTGDLSAVNSIEATNTLRLFEAWVEGTFGSSSLRVGQITVDGEFDALSAPAVFRNGVFGPNAGLLMNMPAPGYPIAALGARFRYDFTPRLYTQVLIADGNPAPGSLGDPSPEGPRNPYQNSSGLGWNWNSSEGVLVLAEIGNVPKSGKEVHWCTGVFYHTDTFSNLFHDDAGGSLASETSSGQPLAEEGNFGLYVGVERQWNDDAARPLLAFANFHALPGDRNALPFIWQAGVTRTGLLESRPEDVLGLGISGMHASSSWKQLVHDANLAGGTSGAVPDAEIAVELTWQAVISKNWILQPDVQWLHHPGASADIDDALVVGLRSTLHF